MNLFPVRLAFLSGLLCLAALFAGCDNAEMMSQWRDREIAVDGKDGDWLGLTQYAIGESDVTTVGLLNDEHNLYLLLRTHDRALLSQVMRGGFTVWFDPYGQKKKTFGVHFPIGRRETGPPSWMRGEGKPEGRRMEPPKAPPEELPKLLEESLTQVELIGPDKDDRCTLAVAAADSQGVKVKADLSGGLLIYELQVPLRQSAQHSYAIALPASDAGQKISVGFETGKRERPKGGFEGSFPGGGMRGGGGMGFPRGGMGPPGDMFKGFNFWANVKLASKKP